MSDTVDEMLDMSMEAMCGPTTKSPSTTDGASSTVSLTPRPRAKSGGGRPKKYVLSDGTAVPSCTTITKRFAPSEGLLVWAHRQGTEGKTLHEARDKAAEIGANVHDAIEMWCKGGSDEECFQHLASTAANDEDAEKALRSFRGFLRWATKNELEPLETEVPLVSERHKYGGTIDLIARMSGTLAIVDWKTGKGAIYPEHIVQVVAYGELWREARGETPHEYHVLRPSKATGGFNHFFLPREAVEPAWRYFLDLRSAFGREAAVKALLG